MEQLYCTIYIVDVSQNPEEVDTITSRIIQLIEDHGGVIKRNNPWGKRRLAYPIRKKTSGFYVEVEFTANSHLNIPQIIEKEYRLNDRVLRYMTYVVSKKELIQREITAKRAKFEEAKKPSFSRSDDKPAAAKGEKKTAAPVKAAAEAKAEETKAKAEETKAKAEEAVEAAKTAPAEEAVEAAKTAETAAPAEAAVEEAAVEEAAAEVLETTDAGAEEEPKKKEGDEK